MLVVIKVSNAPNPFQCKLLVNGAKVCDEQCYLLGVLQGKINFIFNFHLRVSHLILTEAVIHRFIILYPQ